MPSLLWQLHHSEDGSRIEAPKPKQQQQEQQQDEDDDDHHHQQQQQQQQQSDPSAITSLLDLPSLATAYSAFLASHPKFAAAASVDETREAEYPHLRATGRACFDYCGFGLFTSAQGATVGEQRSGFALASIPSASLPAQAAYGSAEPGTLEAELRIKVLDYLNLGGASGGGDGGGYSVVFTASKRAAFGLLAECYDFASRRRLLTVYDHESESVRRLVSAARDSGARAVAASFRWPTLRICGDELAAELKSNPRLRRTKNSRRSSSSSSKGLFVFPTQSRITGAKYSYQWMTLAEKHRWDVLLDVSAMGPKDMGSLGLSLFRPDFIVCSFYKVFGADPTGFGCLLIKNSSLHTLRAASASSHGIGMVRIVPAAPVAEELEACGAAAAGGWDLKGARSGPVIAFSGPVGDASPASAFLQGSRHWQEELQEGEEHDHHSHDERSNGPVPVHDDDELGNNKDHHRLDLREEVTNNDHEDNHRGFYECEIEELDDGSDNATAAAAPSSSTSKNPELLNSKICREDDEDRASSSSSHDLSRANGGAMLGDPDDDSKFRRISRDEGLIDSRRSDMFRRFLPIREDIEEDQDEHKQQQMPGGGIAGNRGNSSSWDAEGDYYYDDEDDPGSEEWEDEEEEHRVKEPLIVCQGLDHASSVGLNKTNCRLKSLMDWLINSMSLLFHQIPISSGATSDQKLASSSSSSLITTPKRFRRRPLVQIFGPKAQPDRGPAVAFNLYDLKGALIQSALVQKLADRSGISLGCGCLSSIFLEEIGVAGESNSGAHQRRKKRLPEKCSSMVFMDHGRGATAASSMKRMSNIPVLTATLGFVSSFEDVYRLWAFSARFLDPEFVSGEALRYQSLNQETVVLTGEQSGGRPSM